mmetsp:Transcript_79390/g.132944  ORF Transcript_79390/g.132944 Transcript_79390/m.132944 type:complete len:289 (+) Transcript_79390:322-1188(+)
MGPVRGARGAAGSGGRRGPPGGAAVRRDSRVVAVGAGPLRGGGRMTAPLPRRVLRGAWRGARGGRGGAGRARARGPLEVEGQEGHRDPVGVLGRGAVGVPEDPGRQGVGVTDRSVSVPRLRRHRTPPLAIRFLRGRLPVIGLQRMGGRGVQALGQLLQPSPEERHPQQLVDRWAHDWIDLQHRVHDLAQVTTVMLGGPCVLNEGITPGLDLHRQLCEGLRFEGVFERHHFIHDHTKCPDIRLAVVWFFGHQLGRHVIWRPHKCCRLVPRAVEQTRDPKITQFDDGVFA